MVLVVLANFAAKFRVLLSKALKHSQDFFFEMMPVPHFERIRAPADQIARSRPSAVLSQFRGDRECRRPRVP